eukprot:373383_1
MILLSIAATSLILAATLTNTFAQTQLHCGDVASNFINTSSHYYQFTTNDTYNVIFDTCGSVGDVIITVFESSIRGAAISNQFCSGIYGDGDFCGLCNSGQYPENFTIPNMPQGQYVIEIKPYSIGAYNLTIACTLTNFIPTNASLCIKRAYYSDLNGIYKWLYFNETTHSPVYQCDGCQMDQSAVYLHGHTYPLGSRCWRISSNKQGPLGWMSCCTVSNYIYDINDISNDCDGNWHFYNGSSWVVDIYMETYACTQLTIFNSTESPNFTTTATHVTQMYTTFLPDECNQTIYGTLDSEEDIDYIYFSVPYETSMLFDSCRSSYDTELFLLEAQTYTLLASSDDDGNCGIRAQLLVNSLQPGDYILEINGHGSTWFHSYGKWVIDVICDDIIDVDMNSNPKVIYKLNSGVGNTYMKSQAYCEIQYGKAVATIVTEDDFNTAIENVNDQFIGDDHIHSTLTVWIGMYTNSPNTNNTIWQCVSGIPCNQDNVHWAKNQPDFLPKSTIGKQQYGVNIFVGGDVNSSKIGFYDQPFAEEHETSLDLYVLCDAPDSKYGIQNCTNSIKCWKILNCCDDEISNEDTSFSHWFDREFYPPAAYWNSTLFIIGMEQIHYTKFELFNHTYSWNHIQYNQQNLSTLSISQRYAQYQSSLYIYTFRMVNESSQDILIHINLDTLDFKFISLPLNYPSIWDGYNIISDRYCMVAHGNYVYVVRYRMIIIYSIDENKWSTEIFDDGVPITCSITNDGEHIYVFTETGSMFDPEVYRSLVIKYNVKSAEFQHLDIINLCSIKSDFVKAITGRDNKIYLQGCYIGSWQTLVFDPYENIFETQTVDISIPNTKEVPYYRYGQLTIFDDNILL